MEEGLCIYTVICIFFWGGKALLLDSQKFLPKFKNKCFVSQTGSRHQVPLNEELKSFKTDLKLKQTEC